MDSALRVTRESLGTLTKMDSGGQGTVYAVQITPPQLRLPVQVRLVYKEYDATTLGQLRPDVLETMAARATRIAGVGNLGRRLAWPLALVVAGGRVSGFVMALAPQEFFVDIQLLSRSERKIAQVQHVLNDDAFLSDRGFPVHDRWRLALLSGVASTMSSLHHLDIVVGDFSPMNLLASFRGISGCFFLDCDAMRIDDHSVLPQVETPGWGVRPGEALATVHSDAFKFALLATRLFARSQDSRDIGPLGAVDRRLGDLAARGLADDPARRPSPGEWVPALDAATAYASTDLPWQVMAQRPRTARTALPPARGHAPGLPGHPVRRPQRRSGSWAIASAVLVALLVLGGFGINFVQSLASGAAAGTADSSGGSATSATASLSTALVTVSHSAATHPRAGEVVRLIDKHFAAINARDYDAWRTTVVAKRAADQPESTWLANYRSTTDEAVAISAISDAGSGQLAVTLTFVSNQDLADAPPSLRVPRICWSSTWPVTSDGQLAVPPLGSTSKKECS